MNNFIKKKLKTGVLIIVVLVVMAASCAAADDYSNDFGGFVTLLKSDNSRTLLRFSDLGGYAVIAHSDKVAAVLKNSYNVSERQQLQNLLTPACHIKVIERPYGAFVQAASFDNGDIASATNYDAVWMRDTIWAYMALDLDKNRSEEAKKVLLTMLDYIATPPQIARMKQAIIDPQIIKSADGQMQAVHIRFNANSPTFDDVNIDNKVQPWNHLQNDALGLLLDATISAACSGEITLADLNANNRLEAVTYLVAYLDAIKFYDCPDSGAWEEDARLNTSSVALVTSALENLQNSGRINNIYAANFSQAFWNKTEQLGLTELNQNELQKMIDNGYTLIDKQLAAGGESPDYATSDAHYRTADAALLNLIYPARLSRLTMAQKDRVLEIVGTLVGDFGIKRYANDNYQCADFWFHSIKADVDANSFNERKKLFIDGTEAQWFFDSWYAKACLTLYRQSNDEKYWQRATKHLNRALGQITANSNSMLGADGKYVPRFSFPESYNFIESNGQLWDVPSPITPLNWAKASMSILLDDYAK